MIPTLYNPGEREFSTNGIGKLSGAIECKVTKERNGIFDLTMKYATGAPHYDKIGEGCIIVSSHDDRRSGDDVFYNKANLQPFRIQKIKRETKYATIEARHDAQIQLAGLPVWPYPSGTKTVAQVMEHLTTLSQTWSQVYPSAGITFGTDIDKTVIYSKAQARFASEFLAGKEGSLVDLLGGGELSYDWYNVKLLTALGTDRNIRISYGKNISSITGETSMGECYTGVFIYYTKDNGIKYAKAYDFAMDNSVSRFMPNYYELDITSEFQNEPATEADFLTVADARATAMENKEPWTNIYQNISVSWYELSQLSEYSHLPKRSVGLGDYVNVYYPAFGIDKKVEIVKTVWDPLGERYDTLELNSMKKSLYDTLTGMIQNQTKRR
jgi:phage minor structural protein